MKILEDEKLGKYTLLKIEGPKPRGYYFYRVGGQVFRPVYAHNMHEYAVFESNLDYTGQEIEFLDAKGNVIPT